MAIKIILFLLAARVHVVSLYFLVYLVVSKKINGTLSPSLVAAGAGFAALIQLGYLLSKVDDRKEDAFNGEPLIFGEKHRTQWRALFLTLFAANIFFLIRAYPQLWGACLYGACAFLTYSAPALRFKNIALLKSLITTFGLFFLSVMPPFLLNDPGAWGYAGSIFYGSLHLVLAVFCLTVLLDIRDISGDRRAGLKTLPVLLGRGPVISVIIAVSAFFAGRDLFAGNILSGINDALIAGFALGALKDRSRRYYDVLISIEIIFLACNI